MDCIPACAEEYDNICRLSVTSGVSQVCITSENCGDSSGLGGEMTTSRKRRKINYLYFIFITGTKKIFL